MKICLVIDRMSNRSGGAEKVVATLANELHAAGFDTTILTWEANDELPFYPTNPHVRVINLMPYKERRAARSIAKRAIWKTSKLFESNITLAKINWKKEHGQHIAQLRSYFLNERPDVAIGFMPSSFPYMVEAAKGTGVKTITSCHNVPERDFEDELRWSQNRYDVWWRKECLRKSDAVTCLLDKFVPWFDAQEANNLHVVPNFVEIPDKQSFSFKRKSKTIAVVGRLAPQKDHATLLKAWALLKDEFKDWTVEIYGDGPLRRELYALHGALFLDQSVKFKGVTRNTDDVYKNASIFCIPSLHEGFGLVTAEAMSFGLPVVGFDDCDGTNDIVTNGKEGLLAAGQGNRAANLADSLRTLMKSPAMREKMGRQSYETVHKYSKSASMVRWLETLASIGIVPPEPKLYPEVEFDITVAIPVYNGVNELPISLASLRKQTFAGSLEILVCDDGSSDGTAEFLQVAIKNDKRIRVLTNETNMGRPFSRQRLSDEAKGKYLTWLDADDEKYPDFLKEQFDRLIDLESQFPERVCATYCYYNIDFPSGNKRQRKHEKEVSSNFLASLLEAKFEAYLWIFLMRTAHVRRCGFDDRMKRLQDLDFFIRFSLLRPKMVRVQTKKALCVYNKVDSGRQTTEVADAWTAILKKYTYLFGVFGPGFTYRYVTHALAVTARYAQENHQPLKAARLRLKMRVRRKAFSAWVKFRGLMARKT